ncbi:hypothetical protein AX14_011441 [Amanita brunnescens Koide BX004]|nr:hypothetical protein AX14_011441 [Amanita brunnescens Koide BX004]
MPRDAAAVSKLWGDSGTRPLTVPPYRKDRRQIPVIVGASGDKHESQHKRINDQFRRNLNYPYRCVSSIFLRSDKAYTMAAKVMTTGDTAISSSKISPDTKSTIPLSPGEYAIEAKQLSHRSPYAIAAALTCRSCGTLPINYLFCQTYAHGDSSPVDAC